jgi:hypothetical protein
MPSYNAGTLERCFTRKLEATERKGTANREFRFYDYAGKHVATTWLSRGFKGNTPVSPNLVGKIKRQLRLQDHTSAFDAVDSCPCSREEWLRLIGATVADD